MKLRATWCAVLLLAVPAVMLAASPQKAGKWQVKMKMEVPGMPFQMPAVTTEVCLTEEDLADPEKSVPKDAKSDCKVSDYKMDGNTVTYSISCPKQKMKGTGEITYTDTSYEGVVDLDVDGAQMKQKFTGKYLGACEKKK